MKKILITAALVFAAFTTASAQFGVWTPSEKKVIKDSDTGVPLIVLTDMEQNDRFIYQTDPMWTPDGKYLLFRSSNRVQGESRRTQFFFIEVAKGRIIQATDGNVSAVFLANNSNDMFVSRYEDGAWKMYVMSLDKFFSDADRKAAKPFDSYLRHLGTFPQSEEMGRPGGWCVSSDDNYAYISVSLPTTPEEVEAMNRKSYLPGQSVKIAQAASGLRKMDLRTGETSIIGNVDFKVGHIQASRFHPEEIVFCLETGGDATQRMWYANAQDNTIKPLYKETPLDWVTHETFGTEDYVYFNVLGFQDHLRKQAHGIYRINLRTDDIDCLGNVEMDKDRSSALTGRGFWHCNSSRDNVWAAGDTFAGSVWVVHIPTGHRIQIASDLKMAPDHAHPFFSPDGTKLCFQSGHYSDGKRLNLVMVDLKKLPLYKSLCK